MERRAIQVTVTQSNPADRWRILEPSFGRIGAGWRVANFPFSRRIARELNCIIHCMIAYRIRQKAVSKLAQSLIKKCKNDYIKSTGASRVGFGRLHRLLGCGATINHLELPGCIIWSFESRSLRMFGPLAGRRPKWNHVHCMFKECNKPALGRRKTPNCPRGLFERTPFHVLQLGRRGLPFVNAPVGIDKPMRQLVRCHPFLNIDRRFFRFAVTSCTAEVLRGRTWSTPKGSS